jgi:hypothetical protein
MSTRTGAVSAPTLGAWLLKTDPSTTPVAEHARSGFRELTQRCVRRSYRTGLVQAGQPVLLWVSGRDPAVPAGIHARGEILGPPEDGPDGLHLGLTLHPVDPPVLRVELLKDAVMSRIEVIRMAAGSNPSYLTVDELARLRARWPQVGGSGAASVGTDRP